MRTRWHSKQTLARTGRRDCPFLYPICSTCLFHLALYPVNVSLPISLLFSRRMIRHFHPILDRFFFFACCLRFWNDAYTIIHINTLHRLSIIGNTVSSGVNQQQHNCWRYTKTSWNLLLVVNKLMPYTSICKKLLTKYHINSSCRNVRILGSVGLSYLGIKATSVIGDNVLFFMVSFLTGFLLRLVCSKALYLVRTFRLNHSSHSSLTTPNFTHLFIFLLLVVLSKTTLTTFSN